MSILKGPYEISIWDDRLTLVDSNGIEYADEVPAGTIISASYFKEIKLCVIGSNTMNSPIRAHEPELKRDIRGENTLTFSIYSRYYDEEKEEIVDNPFIPYLVNERKIKLKYNKKGKSEWLDFIIKGIEENSEDYKYTYTAKDLYVNELASNGFSLVFDQELENNQGTVNQLGAAVLDGTDWEIGKDSEIIQQLQEEALYEIVLDENITATNILTNQQKTIISGEVVYGFYSSVINREDGFFQFIYNDDNNYQIDDNRVIYNANSYFIELAPPENDNALWPTFASSVQFVSEYRGERIVRYQESIYDKALKRYVKLYTDENEETVRGYSETKFVSEQLAQSFITNGKNFVSASGWEQNTKEPLVVQAIPSYEVNSDFQTQRISTLKYTQLEENFLFNSGFRDSASLIGDIVKGDKFIFRMKFGGISDDGSSFQLPDNDSDFSFEFSVKKYDVNSDGSIIPYETGDANHSLILESGLEVSSYKDSEDYLHAEVSSKISISKKELQEEKYGIFIKIWSPNGKDPIGQTLYIKDVQLFRKVNDKDGNICLPDGRALKWPEILPSISTYTKTDYYFYYPNDAEAPEEIEYIYIGEEANKFKPKYTNTFEKIRSITASETNRFDLLQTLSEIFECWCRFDVKHKETGEIMLKREFEDESGILISAGDSKTVMNNVPIYTAGTNLTKENTIIYSSSVISTGYQQQKFVTFHKNIGQENSAEFIYGINLKSIVRNLESDGIVSKLNVKDNNNEFAPNGSCSISRAKENPSGENHLYDFSYYTNQGLLNYDNLQNDLYSLNDNRGWIGYYTKLKSLNNNIQNLIDEHSTLSISYNQFNAEYQSTSLQYEASVETLREKEKYFYELTGSTYDEISTENDWTKEKTVIALGETILKLRGENEELNNKLRRLKERTEQLKTDLVKKEEEIASLTNQKKELYLKFEKKYYRFIQEGPWTSEDYTDDNLYYLDASATLHNSCQPKVSYTINIIELSQIEGYENYSFELGDITHIQDTEFFGWLQKENMKTPYREKIVVTEEIINFDNPEKNTIKVQNYRTQFEDLFQRLTVAAQKIEFRSGAYERASSIVNPDGSIASEALQDAFANNAYILSNSNNNSVTWDERGIITQNTLNPNEIVRITSGGIFLTDDGGKTWITGITGQGINAKTITTGQLNTENVTILKGSETSFRWDSLGINAYQKKEDGHYTNKTFVRFDQYGIYGIKNMSDTFAPTSEQNIWDNASFALTWKGFMLKSGGEGGSVVIDNETGIKLLNENNEELINIGRIDGQGVYGFKLRSSGDEGSITIDNESGIKLLDKNDNKLIHIGYLDEQKTYGIEVGGWKVNEHSLFASTPLDPSDNQEGVVEEERINSYEIKLFSGDSNESYRVYYGGNSVNRNTWRLLVSNKFGVDKRGQLYADIILSGQLWLDTSTLQRIKFTNKGIYLYSRQTVEEEYSDYTNLSYGIEWEKLLEKREPLPLPTEV